MGRGRPRLLRNARRLWPLRVRAVQRRRTRRNAHPERGDRGTRTAGSPRRGAAAEEDGADHPRADQPRRAARRTAGLELGHHLYFVDLPGMRSTGSADWSGLFNSCFWNDRKAGIGAVVAMQLLPFSDAKMVETILGFEAAVYAELGSSASSTCADGCLPMDWAPGVRQFAPPVSASGSAEEPSGISREGLRPARRSGSDRHVAVVNRARIDPRETARPHGYPPTSSDPRDVSTARADRDQRVTRAQRAKRQAACRSSNLVDSAGGTVAAFTSCSWLSRTPR